MNTYNRRSGRNVAEFGAKSDAGPMSNRRDGSYNTFGIRNRRVAARKPAVDADGYKFPLAERTRALIVAATGPSRPGPSSC